MVEATIIIPLLVTMITQVIKRYVPAIQGEVTILVALSVAVCIALIDTYIGVTDVSIAQGIVLGAGAVGINILADKAGNRV